MRRHRRCIRLGAEPAWLLGHSIGEYAAAAIAEVFSLDDACRLVVARGRLMQQLPAGGGMLAVRADCRQTSHGLPLDLAAVNGPSEVVLSGATEAIEDAARALEQAGITVRQLNVSHAFHSQLMEPMTAEFASVAAECSYELPAFPIFSTLHGRLLGDDEPMDADYWTAHVRATVRFADAAAEAMQAEPTHLVEFGAKRTLGPMITRSHDGAPPALNVATDLTGTVAALYRDGLNPDWNLLYPNEARVAHRLSGYSFSTANRFWIREGAQRAAPTAIIADRLTEGFDDGQSHRAVPRTGRRARRIRAGRHCRPWHRPSLRRKRIQLLTRPRSCALRSRASVDSPKRTCAPRRPSPATSDSTRSWWPTCSAGSPARSPA